MNYTTDFNKYLENPQTIIGFVFRYRQKKNITRQLLFTLFRKILFEYVLQTGSISMKMHYGMFFN